MKVLWLTSWYPNQYEPVNGDFIQRHAKAVAAYIPIDVFHIVQLGKDIAAHDEITTKTDGQLTEHICYFSFKKWGSSFIDKIRYNICYKRKSLKALENYFTKYGKPDLIHVHVPMKAGWIALQLKKKYKIPYIVSEQASYYDDAAPDNFNSRSLFFKSTTKKVCRNAAAITNVSSVIAKRMEQLLSVENIYTVHNIADTKIFFYKPLKQQEIFTWVHVSTLSEQKNITGIIQAFYSLIHTKKQHCQLILVGHHVHLHKPLVEALELQNFIFFVGEVPHDKVVNYLQQANAFVLFSRHENFPCVMVEALCCGLPVVASEVGGVSDAIKDYNGLLVQSDDEIALTEAMDAMMKQYANYNREEIAAQAKRNYDNEVIAKQFISIYNTESIFQFRWY
ncbi:MAG: glycosyltransferase [Chitinophagaceae bacterium]|nr:glycosyltransferase [Chitinophagaceae bacterium]MCW5905166.1 glycosyltransferase [Chitinophagaceae bacterium]